MQRDNSAYMKYSLATSVPIVISIVVLLPPMTLMEREIEFASVGNIVTLSSHCVAAISCARTNFFPLCSTMIGTQQYLSVIAIEKNKNPDVHYAFFASSWIFYVYTTIVSSYFLIESLQKMIKFIRNKDIWKSKKTPIGMPVAHMGISVE